MALQALREIARALSDSMSPAKIAEVVARQTFERFGATASVVYFVDGAAGGATLMAQRGMPKESVERLRRILLSDQHPMSLTLRSGDPNWFETRSQLLDQFPHLAESTFPPEHLQAALTVPFSLDHHVMGGLAMSFATERRLDPVERELLLTVGDLAAHAIARFQLQQRFRALHEAAQLGAEVGKALTSMEPLSDQLRVCLEATIRHLNGAFAGIWTVSSAGGDVLERQAAFGDAYKTPLDGPPLQIPVGSFKIGLVAKERAPYLTNDLVGDPRLAVPNWTAREGLKAFAGYPLLVQDRLVGVLAMFSRTPLEASALEALAVVADVVALGIERRRTEALRAETESRRAATLEAAMDCIIVIDDKGCITEFNPAAEKVFQYPREAVLGREMAELLIPPQFREKHREGLKRYLATRVGNVIGTRIEISALRSDGTEFPIELSITPVTIGGAVSFTGYLRDITKRRKADAERAELLVREQAARAALSTTLNSIGDAVIATDTRTFITFMNPVAEALTGWTLVEAEGKPLRTVFHILNERTREVVESPADRVIRDGRVVGLANHTVLIARNGAQFAIDDSGAPIFDADGKLTGVVIVFRDVTSKKKLEDRKEFLAEAMPALATGLDVRQTLINLAQLAVPKLADWCAVDLIVDHGAVPQQIAVAHKDPTKLQLAAELGKRYPPDPNAPTGAPNVLRTGEPELYPTITDEMLAAGVKDAEHLRLARELRLESAMVVPLKAGGRVLAAITFVYAESGRRYTTDDLEFAQDLCRRASIALENSRLYESEQNARRNADLANRTKDDFLATVSHELRTPLNAMLGWTRLLRSGDLSKEKHDRALETIERNAVAQAQLIEDLLDVSRIISGKLRLDVQSMEMSDIIQLAVDSLKLASETKGIRMVCSIDAHAGQIMGDPNRLQQVVWNLISNAIKFTPKGGRIHVSLERVDSNLRIDVTDTGQGIKAEFLPQVFERFKQADGATTRAHGGLGLGLAISRHIVELHGGSIHVKSKGQGQGATFSVSLPISPVRRAPNPQLTAGGVVSGLKFETRPELRDLKILIVDDEADARALLAEVLERCGATVVAADSAADAMAKLRSERPDVLISDVGMPGEDGYELIRRVRSLPYEEGGNIPAAALTAYVRAGDRRKALDAGFMMHIPKPVEPAELIAVIANLTRFAIRR